MLAQGPGLCHRYRNRPGTPLPSMRSFLPRAFGDHTETLQGLAVFIWIVTYDISDGNLGHGVCRGELQNQLHIEELNLTSF